MKVLGLNTSIPSSTGSINLNTCAYGEKQIVDVVVLETTIQITYRQQSNIILTSNPPQIGADQIWKEVFGMKDGRMTLLETIQGQHRPQYTVEEQFIFPTDNDARVADGPERV